MAPPGWPLMAQGIDTPQRLFSPMRSMRQILMATVLLLVIGCSTITPASFSAKATNLSSAWPSPVSVVSGHSETPLSRFNANGMVFEADLNQFSDELAKLVRESLEKAGTPIAPGHKTLEVHVVYLDLMFQGPCLLDFNTRLGNGEVLGMQSIGDSSNFATGCRAAFESAVLQIINDQRTIAYMGGQ